MTETQFSNKRYGSGVSGLNVRFQTVQAHVIEGGPHCQAHGFSHQSTSRKLRHAIIAQIGVLKPAHNNLTEMRDANNAFSMPISCNKSDIGVRHLVGEPGVETFFRYERLSPWSMIRAVLEIGFNQIARILWTYPAQRYFAHN